MNYALIAHGITYVKRPAWLYKKEGADVRDKIAMESKLCKAGKRYNLDFMTSQGQT